MSVALDVMKKYVKLAMISLEQLIYQLTFKLWCEKLEI